MRLFYICTRWTKLVLVLQARLSSASEIACIFTERYAKNIDSYGNRGKEY